MLDFKCDIVIHFEHVIKKLLLLCVLGSHKKMQYVDDFLLPPPILSSIVVSGHLEDINDIDEQAGVEKCQAQ